LDDDFDTLFDIDPRNEDKLLDYSDTSEEEEED
jgi:hypothetical protein